MEKRGIIADGITPPAETDSLKHDVAGMLSGKSTAEKQAKVVDLDNDFRRRAAEAVRTSIN
jgi:hypothetical protein